MSFARSRILQRMPYLTSSLYQYCLDCKEKVCISSCLEEIIVLNPDLVPTLDFSKSGCIFCEECVKACFELNGTHQGFDLKNQTINASMRIDPLECLAWNGSICSSCRDVCLCEIKFAGMLYPEVLSCNGCGLCIARCPVDAIRF